MTAADLFHETLYLRIAFGDLVGRVCVPGVSADDVDLDEFRAGLDDFGVDRAGALLYANQLTDSVDDGVALAREVRIWVASGRRPRTMQEALSEDPEASARVERAFRRAGAAEPWWRRLRERVVRAIMADEETSRRLSAADVEQRRREGKQP